MFFRLRRQKTKRHTSGTNCLGCSIPNVLRPFARHLVGKLVVFCCHIRPALSTAQLLSTSWIHLWVTQIPPQKKIHTTCSLGIGKPLETPQVARFGRPNEKYSWNGVDLSGFEWNGMRSLRVTTCGSAPIPPKIPKQKLLGGFNPFETY